MKTEGHVYCKQGHTFCSYFKSGWSRALRTRPGGCYRNRYQRMRQEKYLLTAESVEPFTFPVRTRLDQCSRENDLGRERRLKFQQRHYLDCLNQPRMFVSFLAATSRSYVWFSLSVFVIDLSLTLRLHTATWKMNRYYSAKSIFGGKKEAKLDQPQS